MPASLFIELIGQNQSATGEVEYFNAGEWTAESELQLLQRIRELLSAIRPIGKTFRLDIRAEVSDIITANFIMQKKRHAETTINPQKLSTREMEIIGLIMQGMTNPEIAEKLYISCETVKSHRKNILLKTGATNTASLIRYYTQTFFDK